MKIEVIDFTEQCDHPVIKLGKDITNKFVREERFYCLSCSKDVTNE